MNYKLRKEFNEAIRLDELYRRNSRMKRKEALNEVKFEWDNVATVVTWRGIVLTVIPPSCSKWERDWMVRAIARTIEIAGRGK